EECCPNGVPTAKLVLAAREQAVEKLSLPFVKKNLLQHFLTSEGRLNLAARGLALYQQSGLQSLIRKTGVLPGSWMEKESLLPPIAAVPLRYGLPGIIAPPGRSRMRVGYFTGCMSNYIYTETGKNVVKVLNAAGCEVVIPDQLCCGMPALVSGERSSFIYMAQKNAASFQAAGVEALVVDCATCGSAWKQDYPAAGLDLPFPVYDISELLARAGLPPGRLETQVRVTYHDPCHLVRYQDITKQPRELLRSIDGVELVEMNNANQCCGASGSFQLEHHAISSAIGHKKCTAILATGADIVATGCPSCRMQIERSLREAGSSAKVVHTADLLALSIGCQIVGADDPVRPSQMQPMRLEKYLRMNVKKKMWRFQLHVRFRPNGRTGSSAPTITYRHKFFKASAFTE
ncbi:MAG: (Fe-S)-binding protein, partial [Desulfotomaculaceae bacterium]